MHGFSFAPRFVDLTMANGVAGDLVAFDRVRVRIVNGEGRVVVDRVVDFPSAATEVPLEITVPLSSGASAEGEPMDLSLAFINTQGDTVFRGGPLPINVVPNQSGSQPPPPVDVPVVYSGTGANAARVVITSAIDTVVAGQSFSYSAEARDAQGAVIPNTPIAWRVITPGKATMSGSGGGSGTTLASRGEALIVAQLLTGQADTLPLEILPLAQSLAIVSGNNQTAALGALLAAPLVVRVNATDGQPLQGITVTFAVTAGGGSVSSLSGTTDGSGLVSVSWTTGTSLAAQTVTATSAGLTGSPATFTAVAPTLSLAFDVAPSAVTVGASIAPTVQVAVRDGQGNIATVFTGNVVLSLGAGSPAGVLSGTLTTAAVAGVATFADLSLNVVGAGYSLVASAPSLSLTSAPSASFAVTAGTPTQLVFTQAPTSAVAGVTITPALRVEARDALGNLVPSFTDAVTLQFQQGSGSLLGTLTVNAVGGVATFADIAITGENLATALRASATGMTAAVSPNFAVANGPAAKLLFFPANVPPPVLAGQVIPTVSVQALDAYDNFVNEFTGPVTIALGNNPSSATLGGTVTANAVAGSAAFTTLTVSAPGVGYTFVASSPGLANDTTDAFTVDPVVFANAWINASGGNWSNPANWSLGRTPQASDTVVIGAAGTYTVTMDVSDTVAFAVIGAGAGVQTLSVGTRQLRVDSAAVVQPNGIVSATTGSIVGGSVVQNAGQIILTSGSHAFALANSGRLTLRGSESYSGVLTTTGSSVIESLAQNGPNAVAATITNGFTNNGLIELRTLDAFFGNSLTVGGTLVNAPGAIIRSVPGFGGKTLAAQLNNQGAVEVNEVLSLSRGSAAHVNSGSIAVSGGNLSVSQSGTTPSFTNTGAITLAAGRVLAVGGGTLTLTGGTVAGPGATLSTSGVTLNFDLPSARTTTLTLATTTVPGAFTVPAGDSLVLTDGSPTMTLANEGRLVLRGSAVLGGTLTTAVGSVLEARAQNGPNAVAATITNGFTNNGLIELRTLDAFFGHSLTVGGTLVNSSLGIIRSVAGFGGKTLAAQLDNQGTVEVNEALTLARASATHVNTGSIVLSGGILSINQSGTTPSFTHGFGGAIDIPPGGSVVFSGGAVDLRSGSVTGGGGTVQSNSTTSFQLDPASFESRLTITGAATSSSAITIAVGDSLRVNSGTFAPSALTVNGTLIVEGTHSLSTSGLSIGNGGLLLVRSSNVTSNAALTLNAPFTTNGTVRLTSIDANRSTSLTMGASALTIGATGALELLSGTGGTRSLATASIDNNGAISVTGAALIGGAIAQRNQMNVSVGATATLQNPMTLFTGSVTTNLGTLNLTGGCVVNGVPTLSGFVCP